MPVAGLGETMLSAPGLRVPCYGTEHGRVPRRTRSCDVPLIAFASRGSLARMESAVAVQAKGGDVRWYRATKVSMRGTSSRTVHTHRGESPAA